MAWIEERQHKGNPPYWRVVWYQDGKKQRERFDVARKDAEDFLALVKGSGGRWPYGWTPGSGYVTAETSALFKDYAERTINARLRADEGTRAGYKSMLAKHINPVIGETPVAMVDRFAVVKIADTMKKAGRAPKTIANAHGLLSSILADAVSDGLIPRNPAVGQGPRLNAIEGERSLALTHGEFEQLMAEIPEGTHRDLGRLLFGTGLRWSEATALQVQDVDVLGKRLLHVRRAWKRRGGRFELGTPKTRRSRRSIPLAPSLIDLLLPHLAAKGPLELVFTTPTGRPIRHSNYYNRVWLPAVARARRCVEHRAAAEPCGCPGTLTKQPGLHSARHTHGSWLIDDGVSIVEVQLRLGHESIQTTVDIYGHPSGAVDAINASVDRRLGSSAPSPSPRG